MADKKTKIMFTTLERTKAEFKIRLQYDNLTQVKFFNAIMDGYINKDPNLMLYLNGFKKEKSIQSAEQVKKIEKNIKEAKKVKNLFSLEDDEVENIFDILEKEHPDL